MTRGVVAFLKDNRIKSIYNNSDSYPSGLGNDVLDFLHRWDKAVISTFFDSMGSRDTKPTSFYDINSFIHNNEGSHFFYVDCSHELNNSLYTEWAYIIDLDTETLEVHEGYNKEVPKGRFKDLPKVRGFYAVSLINEYPFDSLPALFD